MTLIWCQLKLARMSVAKQDEYARITLRLPPDIHAKLIERAGAKSLNAEIVTRLTKTLAEDQMIDDGYPGPEEEIEANRELLEKIRLQTSKTVNRVLKEAGIQMNDLMEFANERTEPDDTKENR